MRASLYGFGDVLMFEYSFQGVLLSIEVEKPLGKRAGSVLSVGSASRIRGSDPPAGQQKTARESCWSDPRVIVSRGS